MREAISTINALANQFKMVRKLRLIFWVVVNRVQRSFSESVEFSLPHLTVIGYVGLLGFPLYYYIWTEVFPQPYESITLRLIGMVLCLGFVFLRYWPLSVRKYLAIYWFVVPKLPPIEKQAQKPSQHRDCSKTYCKPFNYF